MADSEQTEIGWAILELMGHRRLGGFLTEQEIAGAAFIRIDVPGETDAPVATQFYAPSAVYAITPTTEGLARAVAAHNQPQPVQRWELPQLVKPRAPYGEIEDDDLPLDADEVADPDDHPFD